MSDGTIDLTPWKPVPTPIPDVWMQFMHERAMKARGSLHEYVLGERYDAQGVGDLLRSWGLPFSAVMAGYLMAYDKEELQDVHLAGIEEILAHFEYAERYEQAIENEQLPLLLTPPYDDLGALLIAAATYFQWLKSLQQQVKQRSYAREKLHIERVGNSLLNISKRLGMWYFKREVEDALEQLRNPAIFEEDRLEYEGILERDDAVLEAIRGALTTTCCEIIGESVAVTYTACGVAGLKRRLQDAHTTATSEKAQLSGLDLVTYDVVVPAVRECYVAFGALSQLGYIQDRVTDHIANPKNNGYSLIALGLILNRENPYLKRIELPINQSHICQLQIATHVMQAIASYGCVHTGCYDLYDKRGRGQVKGQKAEDEKIWQSRSGRVFQVIEKTLASTNIKPDVNSPIVVYDKERIPIALPINATVLDFAFAQDNEIGVRAVEAIVNNRKAPLYRTLQAGDIVEIRAARQTQADDAWLAEEYAITPRAKLGIRESVSKSNQGHLGYIVLRQKLRSFNYELSSADMDNELRLLLKDSDMGSVRILLDKLESEHTSNNPLELTLNWAAEGIKKQIEERKQPPPPDKRGRAMWIPVIDASLVQFKKALYRQHLCGICRPAYPRDIKILGRLRRRSGELIVHRETCAHLIDRPLGRHSMLVPMIWQLQSPAFVVAFAVMVQDRRGIILDLTKHLRYHECDLLTINAEATNPKTGIGHLYFTIETHSEHEAIEIWNEIYKIENIMEVILDESRTPALVCENLKKLREQHGTLSSKAVIEFAWEEQISMLPPRPASLQGPFDIARPAGGKMFFGRSDELKTMQHILCDSEKGQVLILYGPRRSGKSSLCKQFLERYVHEPFWGMSYSLQNDRDQSEEVILMRLAEKIISTFQDRFPWQKSIPTWQDFSDSDPQVRFTHVLQTCLARMSDSRFILVLDEFGGAIEAREKGVLEFRFFNFWREMMTEISQFSLVIAMPTSAHHKLSVKEFGNVFSFALPMRIDFLDTESANRMLADPLRDLNIAVHPNTVALAVTLTGGNPYYLALIGQGIVAHLNRHIEKQLISDEDLNQIVGKLLMEDVSHNFDYLRTELQDKEEFLILEKMVDVMGRATQPEIQLKKIALQANMDSATVKRYLDRMRMGLILVENGPPSNPFYSFKIELVRRWLTRNRSFFTVS